MAAATLPRLATRADLDAVVGLYEGARRFMAHNGNPTQWAGGYPGRAEAERDLAAGGLWVLDAQGGGLAGVMSVLPGPDPTYARIEGAGWLTDGPYWVMHRMAVASQGRGCGSALLRWLCERHPDVRADTHEDNVPMQRALERAGFSRRGTIWVEDGTSRIAYHHVATGA